MLNTAPRPTGEVSDLAALSLNDLRERESNLIDLILQYSDDLDDFARSALTSKDIVAIQCLRNSVVIKKEELFAITTEIANRQLFVEC